MKKFKFSLDAVLLIKKNEEKENLIRLSKIRDILKKAESEKLNIENYIAKKDEEDKKHEIKTINAGAFMFEKMYLKGMMLKLIKKDEEIISIKNKEEKQLDIVKENKKYVKALNKIKEAQYLEYHKYLNKEQEREIDEFVSFNECKKLI